MLTSHCLSPLLEHELMLIKHRLQNQGTGRMDGGFLRAYNVSIFFSRGHLDFPYYSEMRRSCKLACISRHSDLGQYDNIVLE